MPSKEVCQELLHRHTRKGAYSSHSNDLQGLLLEGVRHMKEGCCRMLNNGVLSFMLKVVRQKLKKFHWLMIQA